MKDYTNLPRVPLNWRTPEMPEHKIHKSLTMQEKAQEYMRQGTPPTRLGMSHGAVPRLTLTSVPTIPLVLKAILDPRLAGGGSLDSGTARKRDPHTGKFAPAAESGNQTTARDDESEQMRRAKLIQGEMNQQRLGRAKFGKGFPYQNNSQVAQESQPAPMFAKPQPFNPMGIAGGGVPGGMPGGDMSMLQNGGQPGAAPLGMTQSGLNIYDDPYHPEHEAFSPEDHQDAVNLHQQQSDMATSSGRIPTALDHQMKAKIHADMAGENMSPVERMAAQQSGDGLMQGDQPDQPDMGQMAPTGQQWNGNSSMQQAGNPPTDAMEQFLTQMPDTSPNAAQMSGQFGDQAKPIFGGNNSFMPGPKPNMYNTQTGMGVGPQSQSQAHAGTVNQPLDMPPDPMDGTNSAGSQPYDPGYSFDSQGDMGNTEDGALDSAGDSGADAGFGNGDDTASDQDVEASGDEGPSTESEDDSESDEGDEDKKESAPDGPFGGTGTERRAEIEQGTYKKSFMDWFNSI